jgi:hypothetical protein|tara:strand:+ start:2647 stop:2955 length:309 start_codon:yes stop_codon:yes gene_type:complete
MKNNEQHYYIMLHATDIKEGRGHAVPDISRAFFSTSAKPATKPFVEVMMEAIKEIGGQKVSHGWVDYAIGKLYIKTGDKKVTAMCPSYSEGHRIQPAYEEVK